MHQALLKEIKGPLEDYNRKQRHEDLQMRNMLQVQRVSR